MEAVPRDVCGGKDLWNGYVLSQELKSWIVKAESAQKDDVAGTGRVKSDRDYDEIDADKQVVDSINQVRRVVS